MTEFTNEPLDNEEVDTVEDDQFEVVVPKEDMIIMDERATPDFSAHELSFVSFYIKQFKTDNLEVMDDFDVDGSMMELNKYILNNINFTRKRLAVHTLIRHQALIDDLMDNIEKTSKVKAKGFTSYEQWQDWYDAVRATGRSAMS